MADADSPAAPPVEVDEFYDGEGDSVYQGSVGDASYTSSITSSVLNYQYENGRRYHAFHEGEYVLPNDEKEQDRLDFICTGQFSDGSVSGGLTLYQSHHIYRMLFGGELYLAPVKNPIRVLDVGTGTGIWAIDYAEYDAHSSILPPVTNMHASEHPEAEVIGNDLSPIQPSWTPPNCRFVVDDFEQNWQYSRPFDYIHGRELEGCVRDWDRLLNQAFQNLVPGGYLEIATIEIITTSDDGTHLQAEYFLKAQKLTIQASESFGKSMRTASTWKAKMIQAGFDNVEEKTFMLPQSPWPKDPKLKELGRYHQVNLLESLPAYLNALFSRVLGWSKEEIEVLLARTRNEIRDLKHHLYTNVRVVYGQKPTKE